MNQFPTSPKQRCPRCGRQVSWEGNPNRPFCSEKCRLIDLGCWADGEYRIAGEEVGAERLMRDADPSDPDPFNP